MALKTDDEDIRDVRMWMEAGGNGDYYLSLIQMEPFKRIDIRISISGGNAPTNIKLAIANLFKEMEISKLNNHPYEPRGERRGR